MGSTNTDLKKASDIEQMALIGKMHNMQWLKSNSQLSGHTRLLHDRKGSTNDTLKNPINEGTKEKIDIESIDAVPNSPDINNVKRTSVKDINEDKSLIVKNLFQPPLNIIEFSQGNMETVWNKDVDITDVLFPNSESIVMDQQKMLNMSLTENIVTVQLEQFSLNEAETEKCDEFHNDDDSNDWDNVHNIPKSENDQVSSKQCHDSNNNNAKSKSLLSLEMKKSIQKVGKVSIKKLGDQKMKKHAGTLSKETCIPQKQGSKSKEDLLNLCNDSNITSESIDSKRVSIGMNSKFSDKVGKINEHNKNLTVGKGSRMKEQQFFKQHFSTLNDSINRSRSFMEGLDDKSKLSATKSKPTKNDGDRKNNEIDNSKRCHKAQVTRAQSYNVQYNRNKPLIKSQQRYLKNAIKPDEDCSNNNSLGFTSNINTTALVENASKKKCQNQQSLTNKHTNETQCDRNASEKGGKNLNVPDCSISEGGASKPSSLPCKRNSHSIPGTKNPIDGNVKEDQTCIQKFKKDSNVYRRSSGVLHTVFKDINGKVKTEDRKRNVPDNNLTKDSRINRVSSVDMKIRSQTEGSRIPAYPHKTSNGASNVNKTDTLDLTTINNVQSLKSSNSCPISTKDTGITSASSTRASQELQASQASPNKTEVQFAKTEHENPSNNNNTNNSNSKASINTAESKSVKFSDTVQEFSITHQPAQSYSDNSIRQSKLSASNSFYTDLQNPGANDAQQIDSYQSVQTKSYFDNNNAQCSDVSASIKSTERDIHLLDVAHQKSEQQVSHVSPQNGLPQQHSCNSTVAMTNGLPYQSIPAAYLSQYNSSQAIPGKTADSTVVSQNPLIASTSCYTIDSSNIVQSDPSSILMHNTQPSVLPPPGFHSHPISPQPNQWNMPVPDMYFFGNVMNPAHPMNVPVQNSRHMCNADFSNIQQQPAAGLVQHPLFYVSPFCMQAWNPLVQYSGPLFQNPPYSTCNTFPNQVLPTANNLSDTVNCQAPASMQSNPYKHFQQMQSVDTAPSFSVPVKLDSYMGNAQSCKSATVRMKDNSVDVHMRANQYRGPAANEYQNSSQESQLMIPFLYGVGMDSMARNGPTNMHLQMNQKFAPRGLTAASYPRMPDTSSVFHNSNNSNHHQNHHHHHYQEDKSRKDDVSKNGSECVPPMVSPRECMYYGGSYTRNPDIVETASMRQDMKPVAYMHSMNSRQQYIPQFQKNATYHAPVKDLSSRITFGRGMRKSMDQ